MSADIKKYNILYWMISVPLLLGAFACSMFFQGTHSYLFVPSVLGLLFLSCIHIALGASRGLYIPKSISLGLICGFGLWAILSLSWSTTPYISAIFTLILSILPVLCLSIILSNTSQSLVRLYTGVILCAVVAFGLWALYQFLFLYEQRGPRIHHPMLNPNNLAALFNMFLLPCVFLFLGYGQDFLSEVTSKKILKNSAVKVTTKTKKKDTKKKNNQKNGSASKQKSLKISMQDFALSLRSYICSFAFLYSLLLFFVCLILFLGLLVTQSRGALLSFGIGMIVFLPYMLFNKGLKGFGSFPWIRVFVLLGAFLALPSLYLLGAENLASHEMIAHISSVSNIEQTYSFQNRFVLWGSSLKLALDNFWLGTGLGSFYYYFAAYRHMEDMSDGYFAHMDPLQFWVEMGIIAPILFYAVLISILLRTISSFKKLKVFILNKSASEKKADKSQLKQAELLRLEILGCFAGMFVLCAHTHISFHLYMPALLIPLSLLLAYWFVTTQAVLELVQTKQSEKSQTKTQSKNNAEERLKTHSKKQDEKRDLFWIILPSKAMKITVFSILICLLIVITGWSLRAMAGIHYIDQAEKYFKTDTQKASYYIKKAAFWAPDSYGKPYEFAARLRLNRLWNDIKNLPQEDAVRLYNEAIYFVEEAQKRNPVLSSIWDMKARLYFIGDGILIDRGKEKSIEVLKELLAFNPMALSSRLGLSSVYQSQNDYQSAWEVLDQARSIPRKKGLLEVEYYKTMGLIRAQLGDPEGAKVFLQESLRLKKVYAQKLKQYKIRQSKESY